MHTWCLAVMMVLKRSTIGVVEVVGLELVTGVVGGGDGGGGGDE